MAIKTWIASTEGKCWQECDATQATGGAEGLGLSVSGRAQAWEGFGGCFNELGWIALSALGDADRAAVIDALFDPQDGCRFNYCRLPIGASDYADEWYSLNETDGDYAMENFSVARDQNYLLPYIKEAQKRCNDLTLFASPWSPPTWMKRPRAYNYGTFVMSKEMLDAYALYFVKFVQAYQKEGISIHQVHPQNEPVVSQKFPSCVWTGDQLRIFIGQHLGPALRNAGLDTEVWLGTLNTDDYDGYPLTVLSDAQAREYVAGVGFQWAGKGAIQRTHEAWPQMRLMQTENECGDGENTWEYATYVFQLLQHYIGNGANAYVYWNMVLQAEGESTWGWKQNSMVTVDLEQKTFTLQPEFYVMKHFSRFVAPGATRLTLSGGWSSNALAFENPDKSVVAVVNNPFAEERTVRFDGADVTLSMPPRSFNTFVFDAGF